MENESSSSIDNYDQLEAIGDYLSDTNQILSEQYSTANEIESSHFSYYTTQLDGISSSLVDIDNTLNNISSSMESSVDTPADYYEYIADIEGQQVFFLALTFGILIFVVFALGLKK